ncbi:MAG: tripartite tricarboxylate transporter substrate-binding protein [Pseudomonadota bacterium]
MDLTRRQVTGGAFALALASKTAAQPAPEWPAGKPLRIIVPFSAGSATDGAARLYGDRLARVLNTAVVIDNRPGASGIIAAELVAKAAPDGTTIFVTSNTTHGANSSLFKKLSYDPVRDFAPVARLYMLPLYLTVRADSKARNAAELIALSKTDPGKPTTFAWPNSSSRLAGESLRYAGGNILGVPYKTNPQALVDLLGGVVDFGFVDLAAVAPHVKAGKLKLIGTMSNARASFTPDIPTIAESVPGFGVLSWAGVFLPAGVPQPIVQRLSAEFLRATADPEVGRRLRDMGDQPAPLGSREFGEFVEAEIAGWRAKTHQLGIEPE